MGILGGEEVVSMVLGGMGDWEASALVKGEADVTVPF